MKLKLIEAVRYVLVLVCAMSLLIVHPSAPFEAFASATQDPNATLPSTRKSTPTKTTSPKPRKTGTPPKSSRPQAKNTTSSKQNRSNPPVTASALAARAKDYLVNTRGIDAERIVTVDGGYLEEATVKRAQEALNAAGYNMGTPDGHAGTRTVSAIRAFQADRGIPISGTLDDATLAALGLADGVQTIELWIVPAGATPPRPRGSSLSNHSAITSAQTGQLSGEVVIRQANGATTPAAGASIDIYRTDMPSRYQTRADRNGKFLFAGLPLVGTYVIAASAPNASPNAIGGVKAGRDINYKITLSPGDSRRFTETEAIAAASSVTSNNVTRQSQVKCPTVIASCPDTVKAGTPTMFSANVTGGNQNMTPAYNWTVTSGSILSGQGTPNLTVDTSSAGGQTITATVEISGVDPNCSPSASCTISVESIAAAHKFDEFGNISFEDQKSRLDNFAIQLQQVPSARGYIIAYAGRRR